MRNLKPEEKENFSNCLGENVLIKFLNCGDYHLSAMSMAKQSETDELN